MKLGLAQRCVAGIVGVFVLSSCGGAGDTAEDSPSPSSAPSAESADAAGDYQFDTTFTGDDLLADDVQSADIPDTSASITWRFPAGLEPDSDVGASTPDGNSSFQISGGRADSLSVAVDQLMQSLGDLGNPTVTSTDVTVGGEDGSAFALDVDDSRFDLVVYFELGEDTVVSVNFSTATPDTEPTPETVKAFNQMVGSVTLE